MSKKCKICGPLIHCVCDTPDIGRHGSAEGYNLDFGPCDIERRLEKITHDFNSSEMFSTEYHELQGYMTALEWVLSCMEC